MVRPLRIAIDAMPVGSDPTTAVDWIARQVFGLTARPLTRMVRGRPSPLGASAIESTDDATVWRFTIADASWSSGERVSAADYARGIEHALRTRRSPACASMFDLVGAARVASGHDEPLGISVRGEILELRFGISHRVVPAVASSLAVSPRHRDGGNRAAGPFVVERAEDDRIVLARNPASARPIGSASHDRIEFVHVPCRYEGVERFLNGEIDVTCDTMFPWEMVTRFEGSAALVRGRSELVVFLRPRGTPASGLASTHARAIGALLDRRAIVTSLHGVADALEHLPFGLAPVRAPAEDDTAPALRELEACAPLRIAYHPFYPNREIVEEIRSQLARAGIRSIAVVEPWDGAPVPCDMSCRSASRSSTTRSPSSAARRSRRP